MARHNPRERKLFGDLSERNRLSEEFRRVSARVRAWRKRLQHKKGQRWQKQYRLSIARAEARLAVLRPLLLAQSEELKARIQEEEKVSKKEITQFEQQYRKEVAELKEAFEALDVANEAVDEAKAEARDAAADGGREAQRAGELLHELRRNRRDAARELRREKRDLKRAEQEIDSEKQDALVLDYELRRVVAEIEGLKA